MSDISQAQISAAIGMLTLDCMAMGIAVYFDVAPLDHATYEIIMRKRIPADRGSVQVVELSRKTSGTLRMAENILAEMNEMIREMGIIEGGVIGRNVERVYRESAVTR